MSVPDSYRDARAQGETSPRTVTESDLISFASITGDYSRMHMDRHFAASHNQGARVVHGLLGASYALGSLSLDAPHIVGRAQPGAYISRYAINYRQPVLINDTLRTQWSVSATEADPGNGQTSVSTDLKVLNHRDEAVANGKLLLCLLSDKGLLSDQGIGEALPADSPAVWPLSDEPAARETRYLEDYHAGGQQGYTEGRTLTEADVVNYAGFSGDYNPLHVDQEYAGTSVFQRRSAHPMLVFNIAFASWLRQWLRQPMPDQGFAGHLADSWEFIAPVYLGDTVHCRYQTLAVRRSRSRPSMGIITFALQLVNQRAQVVQQGEVMMLYPARPAKP